MGKNDRVHVFLRVRPNRDRRGPDDEGYAINHSFEKSRIQFHVDKRQREDDIVNHSVEDYQFEFDRVFGPKTTQEEMFNMVAKDCVLSALDGYNSTIFAYGQTGSGKTYSITGGTESYADRGIIPRALSLVYDECAKRTDFAWTVRISYLQIYNDKGQDLLNRGKDAKTLDDLPPVTVHETDEEVVLRGLEAHPSNSIHEALNLLFLGDTNRLYCETPMNKTSSRSHCIFAVHIEGRQHGSALVRRSKLNLVDLAGSERVGKTGVQGTLLTEAKYINLSLHYLEHVIVALSEQSKGVREHVPYRNSFMTMCLRDSLGGNCRTAMLATAHPAPEYFMETISTCKFAQRVACIKQDARVNEETDPTVLVRRLKGQVAQLSDQLAFYKKGDQNADRKMDGDEYERCREVVQRFVDDPDPNTNISGINGDLPRILACFRIMKGMLGGKVLVPGAPTTTAAATAAPAAGAPPSSGGGGGPTSAEAARLKSHVDALTVSLQQKENEISLLFSLVEKSSAPKFNAETQTGDPSAPSYGGDHHRAGSAARRESAAPQERDPTSLAGLLHQHQNQQQHQQYDGTGASSHYSQQQQQQQATPLLSAAELKAEDDRMKDNYDLSALADADLLKDRQAAFEAFRRSYRKYEQIEKNKHELRGAYDACKAIALEVNSCVDAIKRLKHRVNQLRADRALQGIAEPHADEAAALEQLSEAKEAYRSQGAELGRRKEQIDHMHLVMLRAQEQLTKDFDEWFTARLKQLSIAKQQQQRLAGAGGGSGGGAVAGSGSRAAVAMMQQMEFGGSMVPTASSSERGRAPSQPTRQPPHSASSAAAQQNPYGSGSGSYAPNQPSSAPTTAAGAYRVDGGVSSSLSGTYGGQSSHQQQQQVVGGASFRQRSPPPPMIPSSPAQPQQPMASNGSLFSASFPASNPLLARSSSGANFTEAQHERARDAAQQHSQQMRAIDNASANSLFAGVAGGGGGSSYSGFGASQSQSSVMASSSAVPPPQRSIVGGGAAGGQAMNPYCPQYPSTGDDAADQQLAAMYKARDEMRARLQQQRR